MANLNKEKVFSIPNLLSLSRLGLVPVLLWLAHQGLGNVFLSVLAFSLLTDCFDGFLARKLGQVSDLGARLDTWADVFTYAAMTLGLMWNWPELFASEGLYVFLAMGCSIPPVIACMIRFGTFPSYHTWSAKTAAVLLAPAFFWLILFGEVWAFRAVVFFHIWVALEGVLITFYLSGWRSNVPSIFHLLAGKKYHDSRKPKKKLKTRLREGCAE